MDMSYGYLSVLSAALSGKILSYLEVYPPCAVETLATVHHGYGELTLRVEAKPAQSMTQSGPSGGNKSLSMLAASSLLMLWGVSRAWRAPIRFASSRLSSLTSVMAIWTAPKALAEANVFRPRS